MIVELSDEERDLVIEAVHYARKRIETYTGYPDEAFRRQRLALADEVTRKLSAV